MRARRGGDAEIHSLSRSLMSKKKTCVELDGGHTRRVSVPTGALAEPEAYVRKAHRRNSYEPTDTLSLSRHCLRGADTTYPSMQQPQQAADLCGPIALSDASLRADVDGIV